jgi:hypothetical protein
VPAPPPPAAEVPAPRPGPARQAPAPPAAAPEPVPDGPVAQPLDLEMVRASWPAVLEAVKGRKRSLHAWLQMGTPSALDGAALTLRFPPTYAFHAERVGSDDWTDLFGEVFATLFGRPLRVRAVLDDDVPAPVAAARDDDSARLAEQAYDVAEVEEAAASGALPDDAAARELAIATLRRDLNATVIDLGD